MPDNKSTNCGRARASVWLLAELDCGERAGQEKGWIALEAAEKDLLKAADPAGPAPF